MCISVLYTADQAGLTIPRAKTNSTFVLKGKYSKADRFKNWSSKFKPSPGDIIIMEKHTAIVAEAGDKKITIIEGN